MNRPRITVPKRWLVAQKQSDTLISSRRKQVRFVEKTRNNPPKGSALAPADPVFVRLLRDLALAEEARMMAGRRLARYLSRSPVGTPW